MYLEDFLKKKHMDYCHKHNEWIAEAEWVKTLNKGLPRDNRLSYPSVNAWMNGERNPDHGNSIRLIEVFGYEVLPILGIYLKGDLADVVSEWENLTEDEKEQIRNIIRKEDPAATIQV